MAVRFIKPTAANLTGMTAEQTLIGTDCKNARVVIMDVQMDDAGFVNYLARYFWNVAAKNAWDADPASVLSWRTEGYRFQADEERGAKVQALEHLLQQPQFSNGFQQG
jgi:hypothetical protein